MNDERKTPQEFFERLDAVFHFDLDAAATVENTKCAAYITKEMDGLKTDWLGRSVWLNPPYSRGQLKKWVAKAIEESKSRGSIVAMLIPASTGESYYQKLVWKHAWRVFALYGRLKFDAEKSGAKFSSNLVIFGPPHILSHLDFHLIADLGCLIGPMALWKRADEPAVEPSDLTDCRACPDGCGAYILNHLEGLNT